MKWVDLVLLALFVSLTTPQANAGPNSPFTKSYHTFQGTRIPYYTFSPATEGSFPCPLVICLHGSGERGDDSTVLVKNSLATVWVDSANQARWPCMVVVPQCPLNGWWSDAPIMWTLNDLLDSLQARYRIDTSRVYVTGLSMGGNGTWELVMRHPEKFAAAVVVCGWGDPSTVPVLRNTPVWVFHGANDPVVPVLEARRMIAAMESIGLSAIRIVGTPDSSQTRRVREGAPLIYTEYPLGAHDVWNKAYHDSLLLPWVFSKVKPPRNTLTYVRGAQASPVAPRVKNDTVAIRSTVNNPEAHALTVTAFLTDMGGGVKQDSLQLLDDGLHLDGAAGDGIWGGTLVPNAEAIYSVSVRATDPAASCPAMFADAAFFATAGPISLDGVVISTSDTSANPGDVIRYLIVLKNRGSSCAVKSLTARLTSPDTSVAVLSDVVAYGDLGPGSTSAGAAWHSVRYPGNRSGPYVVPLVVEMFSFGALFWKGQFVDEVTAVPQTVDRIPDVYTLAQNYPNPFNPTTGIRYHLPASILAGVSGGSYVRLVVYDLLGREVAVLVNERKAPGSYEVTFNGDGLASGVYVYRMTAGSFTQSRHMVLLR